MIPSGRLNGYSVNTLRDVLVSSADADSTLPVEQVEYNIIYYMDTLLLT